MTDQEILSLIAGTRDGLELSAMLDDDVVIGEFQKRLVGAVRSVLSKSVPAGWQLAPVEPTPEMLAAVDDEAEDKYVARGRAYSAYKAMLAKRPTPSAGEQK